MTKNIITRLALTGILLIVMLFTGLIAFAPEQQGTTTFRGSVSVTNDLTVTDDVAVSGDLSVDDLFNIDDTDSAITGAQTITPTYSYLQVSPAAVLTLTLGIPSSCDGNLLIVHNLVTTSTTIVDTGATVGGGAVTLGQDDLGVFICGGGAWVEIASPDNS